MVLQKLSANIRDVIFAAISKLGIPAKLIRLYRMMLRNSVKVGMDLSERFDTVRGFKQGNALSCDLFNLFMESVLKKAGVHRTGIAFQKSIQFCWRTLTTSYIVVLATSQ